MKTQSSLLPISFIIRHSRTKLLHRCQKNMKYLFCCLSMAIMAAVKTEITMDRVRPLIDEALNIHKEGSGLRLEDHVNNILETLRPDVPDPLFISQMDVEIKLPGGEIKGQAGVTNLQISGLKDFKLKALQIDLMTLETNFTVRFPKVSIVTNYYEDITIMDSIPVYGTGKANIEIGGLEISGTGKAAINKGVFMEHMRVRIHVDDMEFQITGLYNDEQMSKMISSFLTKNAANFINKNPDLTTELWSPVVENVVNSILENGNKIEHKPEY